MLTHSRQHETEVSGQLHTTANLTFRERYTEEEAEWTTYTY